MLALFYFMTLERTSPCKVNLLLNLLGKRTDGFHELETVIHPVGLCDQLSFRRHGNHIALTCNTPELPLDSTNLVHRAAAEFLKIARISDGVVIHLEKQIPLAAGLGGGSGNGAATLLGLNKLFGHPLGLDRLTAIAASLGSDVPFFLQNKPALATGRGENIQPLDFCPALLGCYFLLVHPGFGISTAWAYQQMAKFPRELNGRAGRAQELISLLQRDDLAAAGTAFYNSLEAPALKKYPLLALFQEFLRASGAPAALMSGSGSTTFAVIRGKNAALQLEEKVKAKFGPCWTAVVAI